MPSIHRLSTWKLAIPVPGERSMSDWGRELRLAVRSLARSPRFTLFVVLCLGLAIGGTCAVFSLMDALLWRPLPYRDPQRLAIVNEVRPERTDPFFLSPLTFMEIKLRNRSFSAIAALHDDGFNLATESGPERVDGCLADAQLIRVLGVQPFLGRGFSATEDASGRHRFGPWIVLPGRPAHWSAALLTQPIRPCENRNMNFKGAHILSIDQFHRDDIATLFRWAAEMEAFSQRKRITRVLEGAVLGNLFFEPSTRSRVSFGAAFNRLGGSVRDTTGFQFSSMAKGESIYDTSRVVSGYVDILVVRHPVEGAVKEFAEATNVPVISGGDGPGEHPTQALLDLYTIKKELNKTLAEIDGIKIAMVGDLKFGRTVHSLAKLLALFKNVEFVFIAPEPLQMPEAILERTKAQGHTVHQTSVLADGLADVDVVYATRVQQERFTTSEEADKYRGYYSINKRFLDLHCRPGTVLMHPLPRDSRPGANELDNDLNQDPSLAIFRQTDNGIPIRMALFALVLGVEEQVQQTAREVNWFAPDKIGVNDF